MFYSCNFTYIFICNLKQDGISQCIYIFWILNFTIQRYTLQSVTITNASIVNILQKYKQIQDNHREQSWVLVLSRKKEKNTFNVKRHGWDRDILENTDYEERWKTIQNSEIHLIENSTSNSVQTSIQIILKLYTSAERVRQLYELTEYPYVSNPLVFKCLWEIKKVNKQNV